MANKEIRRKRTRVKISGTKDIPRLNLYVSNLHLYGQIIDDEAGVTLVSFSDIKKEFKKKGTRSEMAKELGILMAGKAKEKGIKKVVFDRGFRIYHGRVAAFAEGAREGGLVF